MTRATRWSRGSRGNGGTVTRRRGGVQRGVVLVPLALRAAPVSVVSLVHHGHVGGRPERRALARGAPPRVDPRDRVRARLLARLRGARRVVQRRRPVPARLSRAHSARRRCPHRDLRALHRWRLPARHLRSHGAVADQREAGRLSGYAARRRHLRDRVDAVRGADPRRHSLARRHRRDGVARRGLLVAYSAGLGLPFLLSAIALGSFLKFFKRYRPFIPTVERAAGVLLVVVGVLVITNKYILLNAWAISLTPEWLLKRL